MNYKTRFYLAAGLSLMLGNLWAQEVCISTPQSSLVLSAETGQQLKFVYYGDRLSDTDLKNLNAAGSATLDAYPVYGMNCPSETALAVKHADGNMSLQMEVVKVDTDQTQEANLTTIQLKDKVYPFYVDVCYKAYKDVDVIETWTEISHNEKNR